MFDLEEITKEMTLNIIWCVYTWSSLNLHILILKMTLTFNMTLTIEGTICLVFFNPPPFILK